MVPLHFNRLPNERQRQIYDAGNGEGLPGTLARSEGDAPTGDAENGATLHTSGVTVSYPLLVDTALYTINATLTNVVVSSW